MSAPQQAPPPPYQHTQGYQPYQQGSNQPHYPNYNQPYQSDKQPLLSSYGTNTYPQGTTTVIQQTTAPIVVVGGCPACRVGVLEDDYTCLGVCCAILFFPIGILCCLAMKQRRCPNCGAIFG